MKRSRKVLAMVLTTALLLSGFSVSAEAKSKKGVPVCTKKITLTVGSKKAVKVKKTKGVKIKKKSFKSSNKKIVSVSKKGVVKAKKYGSCKVKVTVKYTYKNKVKTKKFKVSVKVKKKKSTVTPAQTSSATKRPVSVTATPGATQTVSPTNVPTNKPSNEPTKAPTNAPTKNPDESEAPVVNPTESPTQKPVNTQKPENTPEPLLNYSSDGVVVKNGKLVDGVSASGNIVIPFGTRSIGKRAFYENANALSFDIPNSVEMIDDEAFGYCTEITELYVPESVDTIGNGIVVGCSKLKKLTIANPNCVIGRDTVAECPSLEECNLPVKTDTCTHDYSNTGRVVKNPTCIETGLGLYICKHCGDQQQVKINALGHVESEDKVTDSVSTCAQAGSSHTYCTICGATMNVFTQAKLEHKYEEKIIKDAYCEKDGLEGFVCKNCGDVQNSKVIPAIGHKYSWIAETGVSDGDWEGDLFSYSCEHCGKAKESYEMTYGTFSGYNSNTHETFSFTGYAVASIDYTVEHKKPVFIIQNTGSTADAVLTKIKYVGYSGFDRLEIDGVDFSSSGVDVYVDSNRFATGDDVRTLGTPIDVW